MCAICGSKGTQTKKGIFRLSVDHDHQTGEIRGLLCHKCNVSLGNFNDDIGLLERAIGYIKGDMAFSKYTKAESSQVLSPEQHKAVESELHGIGKTSAQELDEEQRKALNESIDNSK